MGLLGYGGWFPPFPPNAKQKRAFGRVFHFCCPKIDLKFKRFNARGKARLKTHPARVTT
jgi:hypothetical protein